MSAIAVTESVDPRPLLANHIHGYLAEAKRCLVVAKVFRTRYGPEDHQAINALNQSFVNSAKAEALLNLY